MLGEDVRMSSKESLELIKELYSFCFEELE